MRSLLVVIAAVLIGLAAFGVMGPEVDGRHVSLFLLGLAFWALSFVVLGEFSNLRRK